MSIDAWFISLLTLSEFVILVFLILFFVRLRKSEDLLNKLQTDQSSLLKKIDLNSRIEEELVASFRQRQAELAELDQRLEERRDRLLEILKQAEEFCRSPQFLRQIIVSGHRRGQSIPTLAKATGLSRDEVELILEQARGEL
ncbi:hypothetical protein [Desulfovibrio inopinatus]|uniref:hypothetical protein n=1 Tax=Desulfovibrio inopinatus TaxID=102109 RepID=UPI000485941C|nr:hypothetical protein [Desulfovibrio inopinatus]